MLKTPSCLGFMLFALPLAKAGVTAEEIVARFLSPEGLEFILSRDA